MKAAFFEVTEEEKKQYFTQNLADFEITYFDAPLDENSIPPSADFDIISIFVGSKITPQVINSFPNLKHIAVRATGFDNIDLQYSKDKNISVSNVPSYGSHTVAEFTFGLILSLSRKIPLAINRLKMSEQFDFEGFRGFDLSGKTLGVIGTGKIGSNVIKIAKGFNMKILASDNFENKELATSLDFSYVSLGELLQGSDIVTIHVPYIPQTHHLINSENIFLMKKGSILINTSRGAVVETDALFQALSGEHLAGAGLDVLEEEGELKEEAELLCKNCLPKEKFKNILEDHALIHLPQVIVTPHMAFYTKEAEESIMETTVKNIKGAADGKPENLVIPQPLEKIAVQQPTPQF